MLLDLFGLEPTEYRPFLLRYHSQLKEAKRLVIYHSYLQQEEVSQQLEALPGLDNGLPLQLYPEHPLETLVEKEEAAMLDRLVQFLKEDCERP